MVGSTQGVLHRSSSLVEPAETPEQFKLRKKKKKTPGKKRARVRPTVTTDSIQMGSDKD